MHFSHQNGRWEKNHRAAAVLPRILHLIFLFELGLEIHGEMFSFEIKDCRDPSVGARLKYLFPFDLMTLSQLHCDSLGGAVPFFKAKFKCNSNMNPAHEMVFIEWAILSMKSQVAVSVWAEVVMSLMWARALIRLWRGYATDNASATWNPTSNERNICHKIKCR